MDGALDLPDIVLEKIATKLEVIDLSHFRLVCKRFYSLALPKSNLEKISINLRRLNEYDFDSANSFLESIGFGKFVTLKSIGLESYGCLMDQSTQGKLLQCARNLSSFEGDIHFMDYLSNCKRSIECLNLFCEPDTYEVDHFNKYFRQLNIFSNLKELQINNLLERLPVSSIDLITQNAVNLYKLGFSFIRFHCESTTTVDYHTIDGKREITFTIKDCSVKNWVFNQVGTERFKIMLPVSISAINMVSSPNILWREDSDNLRTLVYVNNYCSILTICPEIDHLFKQDVDDFRLYLRNKLMFEKLKLTPDVRQKKCDGRQNNCDVRQRNYKSFTLAANYITSSVIEKMTSIVGSDTLTKIHLINHRCGKEYPSVAMDQCTDLDILKILTYYENVDVLILESFDKITVDLIKLMSYENFNLRLFRLIKCSAFNCEEIQDELRNIKVRFKVDIVNRCSDFIKSLYVLMYPQYYYYY